MSFRFMFLGCGNYEVDGVWDLGIVDLVVVSWYEVGVLLFINMVCNVIRFVFRDDVCWMFVVDDGGNGSFCL